MGYVFLLSLVLYPRPLSRKLIHTAYWSEALSLRLLIIDDDDNCYQREESLVNNGSLFFFFGLVWFGSSNH
ncbi:hypothetical protein F4775DRAFT_564616 [Biscogniauxia sp. FL1348]|nr:hypothetical protein F4775DRAFT_564616 [Biscogniauxia sp. FL1348]